MEHTESSRQMRGAWEVYYEYILELHDRMDSLVGHDGGMHVTAGEYYRELFRLYLVRQLM